LAQAQQYLNEDIAYFFQKHVISGVDFDFKTQDLIKGFEVEYQDKMMILSAKDKVNY
jgi:hypothetical protein